MSLDMYPSRFQTGTCNSWPNLWIAECFSRRPRYLTSAALGSRRKTTRPPPARARFARLRRLSVNVSIFQSLVDRLITRRSGRENLHDSAYLLRSSVEFDPEIEKL